MYSADSAQEKRKQDYARFQKLTQKGHSIADENPNTALYYINEDPFGRTYYLKSLGEVTVRDPITGRTYQQEEWATKEFITDNKCQLINKVSADLVVGKKLNLAWDVNDSATEDENKWLEDFYKKNKFNSKMYEGCIRNSALGDQYIELYVKDDMIKLRSIHPSFVDIHCTFDEVESYEISWEISIKTTSKSGWLVSRSKKNRVDYVQKKTHYKGKIIYELFERKETELVATPLIVNPKNKDLVDRAITSPFMKTYRDAEGEYDTDIIDQIFVIVEYTGIDDFLLVHWPNYRMFDIYGVSDNGMIENLQNALNNRQTQLNDVLDKHADPAMAGDASYLDSNGNLTMSGGGGRFFPITPGEAPPIYLSWDGHLEDTQKEIKRIYTAILDNTETSPALLGKDDGGIQSGRALMYKLIRSLAMAARKAVYMKEAIVDIIITAQKLNDIWITGNGDNVTEEYKTEWENILIPTIEIQSAIPSDTTEAVDMVIKLVSEGIITQETAIDIVEKYFDEIEAEEEKIKQKEAFQKELLRLQAEIPPLIKGIPNMDIDED